MLAAMTTVKPERLPQSADKYIVRLPDGMREAIAKKAKAGNRSMNAEIVAILAAAITDEGGVATLSDGALLDEVVARYSARGIRVVIEPMD